MTVGRLGEGCRAAGHVASRHLRGWTNGVDSRQNLGHSGTGRPSSLPPCLGH